jgi:hypothetical protein
MRGFVVILLFFCYKGFARSFICIPADKELPEAIQFKMNMDTKVASLKVEKENIPVICRSRGPKWLCKYKEFEVKGTDLGYVTYTRYSFEMEPRSYKLFCQHIDI